MAKKGLYGDVITRTKKKRPGVHAKTKTSKLKQSNNYLKLYKGQGK